MKNNLIKACHWEITQRCNLSCIHCISFTDKNNGELSTNEAIDVIKKLNKFGCQELYLTGGEPLIRKDLFQILKEAVKNKMYVGLITNGFLINKKNIKKIKLYINEVGISLDGSSSIINDKIRGKGTFQKVLEAINLINLFHIPLTLYITLNKINLSDIENILKLSSSLKIKRIRINEVSFKGRACQNKRLLKISKKKDLKKYLLETLNSHFSSQKEIYNQNCNIDSRICFLSPLGNIYPCIEIFQLNSIYHFGNILDITIEDFSKYKHFFSQFSKEKCPYEEIQGNNFSLCLNSSYVRSCPIEKTLCETIKSIH